MFRFPTRSRPARRSAAPRGETPPGPRFPGRRRLAGPGLLLCLGAAPASAQFAFLSTAAPRPEGAVKVQHTITAPFDEGPGASSDFGHATSVEYGLGNAFSLVGQVRLQAPAPAGLSAPVSLPGVARYAPDFAGVDLRGKYRFLDPEEEVVGLSTLWSARYAPGRGRREVALESGVALWKHFRERRLTWQTNVSIQALRSTRSEVAAAGAAVARSRTETGVELEIGTGLAVRFADRWYLTGEAFYEDDLETGSGGERAAFRAGPGFAYRRSAFGIAVGFRRRLAGGGPEVEQDLRVKISLKF